MLLLGFSGLILIAAWRMLTACPTCTRSGEAEALEASVVPERPTHLDFRHVLLILVAGTGVGFLTGLFGVGGGFVIVPALTLLLGFAMPQAIGTSLLVVAINSATALAARAGSAHLDWLVTGTFTLAAVGGVLAGGHIAGRIDAERSLQAFAVGLVVLALFTAATAIAGLV